MINLLETALAIILVVLVVMTIISEPAITFQYGKAMTGSATKLIKMVKPVVQKTIDVVSKDNVSINDTNQNAE